MLWGCILFLPNSDVFFWFIEQPMGKYLDIFCVQWTILLHQINLCSAWGANQMQLHLVYWSAVIIISTKGLFPPPDLAHLQLVSCAWTHLLHIPGIWSSRCDCATLAQFVQRYMIVALTYDALVDNSFRSLLAVTEYTSHALCTDSASSQQECNQVSFISNWASTICCIHCSAWNLQRQCT